MSMFTSICKQWNIQLVCQLVMCFIHLISWGIRESFLSSQGGLWKTYRIYDNSSFRWGRFQNFGKKWYILIEILWLISGSSLKMLTVSHVWCTWCQDVSHYWSSVYQWKPVSDSKAVKPHFSANHYHYAHALLIIRHKYLQLFQLSHLLLWCSI